MDSCAETKKLRGEDSLLLVIRWLQNHRSGLLGRGNLRANEVSAHPGGARFVQEANQKSKIFKDALKGGGDEYTI